MFDVLQFGKKREFKNWPCLIYNLIVNLVSIYYKVDQDKSKCKAFMLKVGGFNILLYF